MFFREMFVLVNHSNYYPFLLHRGQTTSLPTVMHWVSYNYSSFKFFFFFSGHIAPPIDGGVPLHLWRNMKSCSFNIIFIYYIYTDPEVNKTVLYFFPGCYVYYYSSYVQLPYSCIRCCCVSLCISGSQMVCRGPWIVQYTIIQQVMNVFLMSCISTFIFQNRVQVYI